MAVLRTSTGATGGLSIHSSPLLLDDPERGWRVVTGTVHLFAVDLVGGEPSGRRHAVGSVTAGAALFGLTTRDGELALIATGLYGTHLEPLDETTLEAWERAGLAEGWATLLADAAAAGHDRASVLLRTGRPASVEAGAKVASLRGTVWIPDSAGLALDGTPLAGALPLPPGLVLEAQNDLVIDPVDAATAVGPGAPWRRGLETLGEAALAGLSLEIASRGAREREAAVRRDIADREATERVYTSFARVVDPDRQSVSAPGEDPLVAACRVAGRPLGIDVAEPERVRGESFRGRLQEIAQTSGFRIREVALEEGWWRREVGPLIGLDAEEDSPVALVWHRGHYDRVDPTRGSQSPLDGAWAARLAPTAYMPYASLGPSIASGRRLMRLGLFPARSDLVRLLITSIVLGLLSLLIPIAAQAIFTTAVPQGARGQILGISLILVGAALGTATVYLVQGLAILRIEARASLGTQAAVIDRLIDLPAAFFRNFTAGDLGARALAVETIRQSLTVSVTAVLVALMVALVNLVYILFFDVWLGLLALALLLSAVVVLTIMVRRQIPPQRRLQAALGQTQALALQILGALPKLRVARAEERAFTRWAAGLGRMKAAFVDAQRVFAGLGAFTAAWQALAIALMLLVIGRVGSASLSTGEFVAFTTAFATTAAAILGLVSVLAAGSQAVVLWERARPIVESAPESSSGGVDLGELSGAVEVAHLSFRYGNEGPTVLDDVSFAASPGEFVAIVGPSGAGKSTLFRLLLGFEEADAGTVSFDGQSLAELDARAVRRQLGVVIQNARILAGTIFDNIVGAANLTVDDAWEAARIAGIAQDIERMPMGMHTFISDSAAAFSGGQRQRLLIARAVVARPRVLLFDEATSALDNRTQAAVSAALDELQSTRLVIAHRLSTIRNADQIVVLEHGHVAEHGRYDELMDNGGLFSALARRQIV